MGIDKETSHSHGSDLHESPAFLYIVGLSRYTKRAILISLDLLLLCFALWLAYSLRLGIFYIPPTANLALVLLLGPVLVVLAFHYNGLYKLITRFAGRGGALKVVTSVSLAVPIWCLIVYMSQYGLESLPRSVIVMFGLFSVLFAWAMRSFVAYFLRDFISLSAGKKTQGSIPVMVYGVGELGDQLYSDLSHSSTHRMIGFIDDNPSLWRQKLHGLSVFGPDHLAEVVQERGVKEIYLASPTVTRRRKRQLINLLAPHAVQVKTLPAHHEIASGKVLISDLKNIGIEDLLGRPAVPPIEELLNKNVFEKCVMITGAGGSIGSEIARQVAKLSPKRIVLFEQSELALYQIEHDLIEIIEGLARDNKNGAGNGIELVSVLGSVLDEQLVRTAIRDNQVETLYHAAAYKHVPIVEENPFVGLRNNVFGTLQTARAANECDVELFVLVSTDKAVRPTNVMGASKRIAELCLQALASQDNASTVFTMVRFGNVLGSSGSVVGRFKKQIVEGGPITVTHPDIIRYFMMIPEAAQLVIQAGGLASGGDVFVLDMGQPVKIVDLAKSMINLSGLEVEDEDNPDGDIAIEYVGLRDGEKLFEELLISENSTPTEHSSIIQNHEACFALDILQDQLDRLDTAINSYDNALMNEVLSFLVEGYENNTRSEAGSTPSHNGVVDHHAERS